MKHRGTGADQGRCQQQQWKAPGEGQQQQADECKGHARGERVGSRTAIGIGSDDRLQERGGDLERKGQQADLPEAQLVGALQHRIQRGQQRLLHVVQQVAEADRGQDREGRPARGAGCVQGCGCFAQVDLRAQHGLAFTAGPCGRVMHNSVICRISFPGPISLKGDDTTRHHRSDPTPVLVPGEALRLRMRRRPGQAP